VVNHIYSEHHFKDKWDCIRKAALLLHPYYSAYLKVFSKMVHKADNKWQELCKCGNVVSMYVVGRDLINPVTSEWFRH